jgi:methyltransferase-like protein/SAM-dependent methyltransferase
MDTTTAIKASYDELPYSSYPVPYSSIENIHAVAHIFGLDIPNPASARVLEIGCASGGNLVPMAKRFPESVFVGVDLSTVQISEAIKQAESHALNNIEFHATNIVEFDMKNLEKFDYILCHGVYSWVASDIQKGILNFCAKNLSESGVAFISYNTYPGWKSLEVVRDAMRFRAEHRQKPEDKLSYGLGMLEFIRTKSSETGLMKRILDSHAPIIENSDPTYLVHEFLEIYNSPCYFKDFVLSARDCGLDYLADADAYSMYLSNYSHEVSMALQTEAGHDQVLMEQYLDYLNNRTFRQSLLIPKNNKNKVSYKMASQRLRQLSFAGMFTEVESPSKETPSIRKYKTIRNGFINARNAIEIKILDLMSSQYPRTVSFDQVLESLPTDSKNDELLRSIENFLEGLIVCGAVRFRRVPVSNTVNDAQQKSFIFFGKEKLRISFVSQVVINPRWMSNLWHETLSLNEFDYFIAKLIQDSPGISEHELLEESVKAIENKVLVIKNHETSSRSLPQLLKPFIQIILRNLNKRKLLVIESR